MAAVIWARKIHCIFKRNSRMTIKKEKKIMEYHETDILFKRKTHFLFTLYSTDVSCLICIIIDSSSRTSPRNQG